MKRITLIVGAVLIFAVGFLAGASTHRYRMHSVRWRDSGLPRIYRFDTWTGRMWISKQGFGAWTLVSEAP